MALLALIASSRDDGIPRDRALALLWPELDSERARNNLKQLVFSLRRALAPDAIVANGGTLRLEPNVITADVWAYERSIAEGALENAVARYGGPFLDGFNVPGLTEFERWVEAERERLARVHAETLETLAERARRAGQFEIAAAWRRHLAALDPLSARHAVSFVRSLADAGDVPGALRHAHLFERLVRSELDADVGPEMRLLVTQLRLRGEPNQNRAVTSDEIAILTANERAAKTAEYPAERPASADADTTPVHAPEKRRFLDIKRSVNVRRAAILALAVANMAIFGLWGRSRLLGPTTAMGEVPPDAPATIAVFAFDGRASPLTSELAHATAELLTASLDGGTGLTAVSVPSDAQASAAKPSADSTVIDVASAARTAQRLGARLFVLGRIVEVGGRLRVSAALHDLSRPDPVARASADGSANEMFEVVDRVASQLLAGRFPGTRGALARAAATTSRSLPAAKAYFAAEQHIGNGRFSAAIDALRAAVRLDSTFALAYYRMSHAAELIGDEIGTREAADAAVRASQALDEHYRRVLAASAAREAGDVAAAERAFSRLTIDYPTDADAWSGLGESLFHLNPMRGRSATDAREAFAKAVEIDPRHIEALVHLARIEALRGDSAGVDQWLNQARSVANDDLLARLALHVRDLNGVDRQRLQRASTRRGGGGGAREILAATDPEDTERFASQFLTPDVPGDLAAYGHRLAAYATAARGQYKAALRHLDEAQEFDVDSDVDTRSLIVATPGSAVDSGTIAQTRMAIERWQPSYLHDPDQSFDALARTRTHALMRLHRMGLVALRAGDIAAAERAAARLSTTSEPDSETTPTAKALALSLRARIAVAAGDSAGGLALLDQLEWSRVGRMAAAEPLDRLLHADLLGAAGRYADAVRWYATIGEGAPQELPLVGFAALGMARASERLGDRAGALREYRRVEELWRDADPALQAVAGTAGKRIAALDSAPPR